MNLTSQVLFVVFSIGLFSFIDKCIYPRIGVVPKAKKKMVIQKTVICRILDAHSTPECFFSSFYTFLWFFFYFYFFNFL